MKPWKFAAGWKSEGLALIFGMLVVLIVFGDALPGDRVGNLDTVFGQGLWPVMDVVYPLASILVFLYYGRLKGTVRLRSPSGWILMIFLISLTLIQLDDFFVVINHPIVLPDTCWTAVRWLYLIIAPGAFLVFGIACSRAGRAGKPLSGSV